MDKSIGRPVSAIEFHGIMKGTIPVCDEFGQYNHLGFAIIQKNGKVGLVNRYPEVIIEPTADSIEFLNERLLLVHKYDFYYLYNTKGDKAAEIEFVDEATARAYALLL